MTALRQASETLTIATTGQGFTELTPAIVVWLGESGVREGLLTVLVRHTSASVLITENAAGAVRADLARWLARLAPEAADYAHDDEGADDMPAHLRAVLTGVSVGVPVLNGRMRLGTWQGIYLAEHRRAPHRREIALHVIGQ